MTHEEFIAEIEKMTVLELNDLVKALEEKFGVSAAAAVVAVPGAAGAAAPAEEEAPAAQLYEDGTWRAAFKGFGGPVMVALTLDDNLTIQSIQIGDDQFAETEGYGAQALEPAFQEQFIGKTLPLKDGDVDGISGATMSAAQGGYGRDGRLHWANFFELAEQPLEVTMALSDEAAERLFARIAAEGLRIFYTKVPVEFGITGEK